MRLTIKQKDDLCSLILDKKYKSKMASLEAQIIDIAQDEADHFYTDEKVVKWIAASTTTWLHEITNLTLKVKGETIRYQVKLKKGIRILAVDQYSNSVELTKPNASKLLKILKKMGTLQDDKDRTYRVISSALCAVNTRKQLSEHYPSIAEYLPKVEAVTKALAITNTDVMKVLPKS